MKKNDYVQWLTHWFKNRIEMPEDGINKNFFEEKWLDSFKIIELISSLESEFNLQFEDAHFNDPRFSTIIGLSDILYELENNSMDM